MKSPPPGIGPKYNYSNMKMVLTISGTSSLLDNKLARWSTASCALTLACLQKKEKENGVNILLTQIIDDNPMFDLHDYYMGCVYRDTTKIDLSPY